MREYDVVGHLVYMSGKSNSYMVHCWDVVSNGYVQLNWDSEYTDSVIFDKVTLPE